MNDVYFFVNLIFRLLYVCDCVCWGGRGWGDCVGEGEAMVVKVLQYYRPSSWIDFVGV